MLVLCMSMWICLQDGKNALHVSAGEGKIDVVNWCLQHGFNVNAPSKKGMPMIFHHCGIAACTVVHDPAEIELTLNACRIDAVPFSCC
jgi:hypothetical protein